MKLNDHLDLNRNPEERRASKLGGDHFSTTRRGGIYLPSHPLALTLLIAIIRVSGSLERELRLYEPISERMKQQHSQWLRSLFYYSLAPIGNPSLVLRVSILFLW